MRDLTILYDEPQEADWFRGLHPHLAEAGERAITEARSDAAVQSVLAYDRPDVVLLHEGEPILVVEETVEVPSGHNVGQRFARIAAAAEAGVPCLYFGPFVAKKHGGETAGPRFMNARLFYAFDAMERTTGTSTVTINWPVDGQYEVMRGSGKDAQVREYMSTFFECYVPGDLQATNERLFESEYCQGLAAERNLFVRERIKNPEQYDGPPPSVEMLTDSSIAARLGPTAAQGLESPEEVVLYRVGMTRIRSDPYTGMAMLYRYLYIKESPERRLVLWFPSIDVETWRTTATRANRKDIRLFRIAADAILFEDGLLLSEEL